MADWRVLVVDDSALEVEQCVEALARLPDIQVEGLTRSAEALERLGSDSVDLLITDLRMPVVDGMDLLRVAQAQDPDMPVLLLTGYPSVDTALRSLKAGAADYLTKPVHPGELVAVVERLLGGLRLKHEHGLLERRLEAAESETNIVGASPAIVELLDLVRRLADSDLDILLVGETGTGKELVARRIHTLSAQAPGRFVPVDCGAIPEQLLESELYGHEKGAFTGADRRSMGLLEYAGGGTFFLDELHSMSPGLQAKLLRTLQERTFRRVGSNREQTVEVRVVAALNRDPGELVREGRLREDLYHRLNVGRVELPPLRERTGDVPILARHFLQQFGRGEVEGIEPEAMKLLEAYSWPGNVRELRNLMRRIVALTPRPVVTRADLPETLRTRAVADTDASFTAARDRHLAAFEKEYLTAMLRQTHGDVSAAAQAAEISRATFYRLLKKHRMDPDRFRSEADAQGG